MVKTLLSVATKKQRKTMKRPNDKLIAGIDLNSNNVVIGRPGLLLVYRSEPL